MDSPIWKNLPEDIVVKILERLLQGSTVKEAVQTSLVSHGCLKLWWGKVWNSLTRLDFEDGFHGTNNLQSSHKFMNLSKYSKRKVLKKNLKFMKFVSHALDKHQGIAVDCLRIAFDATYSTDHAARKSLANWVRFARNKSVRSLELDLNPSSSYVFPEYPSRPILSFPTDALTLDPGLTKLTSLSLNSFPVSIGDFEVFLQELVNLETLVIENAPRLAVVGINAQKLRHLEFRSCDIWNIDIYWAPNLECLKHSSMTYKHESCVRFGRDLHANRLPELSNVSLCRRSFCQREIYELQYYVPNLEKLELKMESICSKSEHDIHPECSQDNILRGFPELINVKELVLNLTITQEEACIMDLMFIVSACPNLQNVTFNCPAVQQNDGNRGVFNGNRHWDQTSYNHQCLRVVEFVGWSERKPEVEFANYLVDSAPNLEKVTYHSDRHGMQKMIRSKRMSKRFGSLI